MNIPQFLLPNDLSDIIDTGSPSSMVKENQHGKTSPHQVVLEKTRPAMVVAER